MNKQKDDINKLFDMLIENGISRQEIDSIIKTKAIKPFFEIVEKSLRLMAEKNEEIKKNIISQNITDDKIELVKKVSKQDVAYTEQQLKLRTTYVRVLYNYFLKDTMSLAKISNKIGIPIDEIKELIEGSD